MRFSPLIMDPFHAFSDWVQRVLANTSRLTRTQSIQVLPVEIVQEIISHVGDSYTLRDCSLVCKKWLNIVRPVLFNELTLCSSAAHRLARLLESDDAVEFVRHIKKLYLREIDFSHGSGSASPYCMWNYSVVREAFSDIIHLEISDVKFNTFSEATEFICLFPILKTISIMGITWKPTNTLGSKIYSLPDNINVQSLSLTDKTASEFSDWVITQCKNKKLSLQKLDFETHELSSNRSVCRLVDALGTTLQELRFSMTFESLDPTHLESLNETVGVKRCVELKHLYLDNIIIGEAFMNIPRWIPVVLSQVESQVLTKVTMKMLLVRSGSILTSLSMAPWGEIDNVLCKEQKYPSLDIVVIEVQTGYNHADVENFIETNLPRVVERDKLEIKFVD